MHILLHKQDPTQFTTSSSHLKISLRYILLRNWQYRKNFSILSQPISEFRKHKNTREKKKKKKERETRETASGRSSSGLEPIPLLRGRVAQDQNHRRRLQLRAGAYKDLGEERHRRDRRHPLPSVVRTRRITRRPSSIPSANKKYRALRLRGREGHPSAASASSSWPGRPRRPTSARSPAHPHRPRPRRQQEVPRPPPGHRQLLVELRGRGAQDQDHRRRLQRLQPRGGAYQAPGGGRGKEQEIAVIQYQA